MTEQLKVGDWVSVSARGRITNVSKAHGLCYKIDLRDNEGRPSGYSSIGAREAWFEPNEVSQDNGERTNDWRDVAADMIRLGRDRDAIALFCSESPEFVPYMHALERLYYAVVDGIKHGAIDERMRTIINRARDVNACLNGDCPTTME